MASLDVCRRWKAWRAMAAWRAALALRFRRLVGEPPIAYLTPWRMLLAGHRLLNSGASVAEIAYGLGYESDSAFSAAFKRVMGGSRRAYLYSRGRRSGGALAVRHNEGTG
ncbi:helix-turn-helix domain-containing protein [Noviherbaspirillum soli]|uniref:helix-turn-helix domain-containing protein n=1 Tax=Noviherbaspirillum soli TaxID=1064518 RepID=UPI00188CDC10|nr:helix-turn-helix domain-containing protein [Noviherbaspirillum soli]